MSAHIRNEDFYLVEAVEEFLTVVKAADVTAILSHHKSMHKKNWGKVEKTLKMIDDAVKEGYDIYCDVYPYTASHTSLVATIIPKEMRATNNAGIAEMLKNPENRKIIKERYIEKFGEDLSVLQISHCVAIPECEGKKISDIGKMQGKDPFEAAFDIIIEAKAIVGACNFCINEEEIEAVMKYERSMIATDSSVAKESSFFHPRLKATFPRALGRYVRERKVVSLEEMIRKCTSLPARVYGLTNKGLLSEGYDADICIFDAGKIIDKADFVNCNQRCEGLNYVILDGEIVVNDAVYSGTRKGFLIKKRA